MNDQGKVWGRTREIVDNPFVSFHRAEIKAGFRCSKHKHRFKPNLFYVESGVVDVRVWNGNFEDVTRLQAGETMTVPAGVYHRFEGVEDAVVFELYWPQGQGEDIVRQDQGGPCG